MVTNQEIAIEIKNLSKSYPGREALNDVSFVVKKGSVHGFLGPNGAGKSTTMKILSGLIPPTSGDFNIRGKVGFLPEHPPLYSAMTVRDYLQFVFDIYSPDKKNENAVNEVMKKTGLIEVKDRLIGNLSKGYQQRVGIAQALVHSPEIIILDEPTVGLDPVAILEIRELITSLRNDHTILFSTHQLHDVELLCSDITLINSGKIVVTGELGGILESLKTKMIILAHVEKFQEEDRKKMLKEFDLDEVIINSIPNQSELSIRIIAKAKQNLKQDLARFLASSSIGLLEFGEEKMDLEEVFKLMVK